MRKLILRISTVVLILALFISCQSVRETNAINYSDPENWAYYAVGEDRDVDLFLICPTVDMGADGNLNMSMDNEEVKASFVGALNMERGIYDECTTMYAPFYRQMVFPLYENMEAESGEAFEIAYSDIEDAFLYYLGFLNGGRPFILAGFSQGAELALMLLKNHFDDERLQDLLVAAYCIGWKVTDDDLTSYPHLAMAEREDDIGVIVSFNTESIETNSSIIVPEGVRTNGINPLNWRTDSSLAERELNKGACFTDYSGGIISEIPSLTGAYLDCERGTLKVTDITPEDYSNALFPDGVYHLYDYQFFFRNLEENVKVRIKAWMGSHS